MTKIIDILVMPDGQTQLQTKGFQGESCRQASAFLERALGGAASEQLTAEFYQLESQRHETRQRQ